MRNMFTQDYFLQKLQVKGEVSNCKYHTSGHIYFSLKDETGTLSCVMFAGQRKGLAFRMKDGDQVVVVGTIDVYQRDGRYQMYAREITLEGAGDLYRTISASEAGTGRDGHVCSGIQAGDSQICKAPGSCDWHQQGLQCRISVTFPGGRNPICADRSLYPALVQGEKELR